MYVDDLLSGGQTVDEAKERKRKSIDVFNDANFNLHKWNSNAHELEADEEEKDDEEETLAKQQLGTKSGESKVLGLLWKQKSDEISIVIPSEKSAKTKGEVLIAGKSRLAKEDLTVPRLELVSAHMAANLLVNVRNALDHLSRPQSFAWLDSTVALHWILGRGQYKQFVSNRVRKIHQHPEIKWRYVPTSENPADLASRGGKLNQTWLYGLEWLSDMSRWPSNITTTPTTATEAEATVSQKSIAMTTKQYSGDVLEQLLRKCSFKRALRVSSWLFRFVNNCTQGEKRTGPLSFTEIEEAKMKFVKQAQKQGQLQPKYEQQCKELNLTRNTEGILQCRGRIVSQYPIYLPTDSLLAQRVVEKLHRETLHGGVGLTMAAVRETYWIPKLISLVKKVRKECLGCKRYRATSVPTSPPRKLPEDRTCGETAFEVIGVDFAGPIRYKGKSSKDCKAYLSLFSCSLTRTVYLDMMPDLSASTFIPMQINRRPLSYVESDVQLPVLTPELFLFQRSNHLPEQKLWVESDPDSRKRARYLKSCKQALWKRWSKEYLTALREQHNMSHWTKKFIVNVGDVVLIKSNEKNRGKWPLGIVIETYPGRDGVIRGVMLKTPNGNLERPVQLLYPMELACDRQSHDERPDLNPDTEPFKPKRKAAENAAGIIKSIADEENEEI
ncbi:uncharacterized protein LOC124456377 [Xenia sp. Carnegie-2017]|uniref:uncharacterized protein LOC124456377 n=1 Tax=Xenia sp. Carnegie-2017 TaxID=2897299 RepID=UPI001F041992|nr:uncharacterized protein LOC124456377 [Xenia sp. Carnegie-2017]